MGSRDMQVRAAAAAGALTVAALVTCCGGGDGEPVRDGGVDGGRDGSPADDGGRDGGRDGGTDAGPPPAAEWQLMPGTVEGCDIERADAPAGAARIEWEPCPGLEGCEQITGSRILARRGALESGVGAVDTAGRPLYFLLLDLLDRRPTLLLMRGRSAILAAWRNRSFDVPGTCGAGSFAVSRTSVAFETRSVRGGLERLSMVYRAPHEEAWRTVEPIARFGDLDLAGDISLLPTSDVATGVDVRPRALLAIEDEGPVRLPAGGVEMPENFSDVTVVGRRLFWIKYAGGPTTIMTGGIGLDTEVYWAPEGGEVFGLATDGLGRIAWVEGYGPRGDATFERTELWMGTVTEEAGDFAPRKVAEGLPGAPLQGRFMAGQYGFIWDGVQVIDVETGARRVARPPGTPETLQFTQPAYVTEDEVLVEFVWAGVRRPRILHLDVLGVPAGAP